ncbi:membrane dipeptidase [Martelella alba]|uniref:Membrane dipeptidase n=1 Tax=Martelella alba TaxID=2590451 RepID=A0A506UBI1_9HYPH|nr:dipeptidase [Martelella alba]TPW29157.1 membrane dipeptidase [Martelella alba]
MTTDSAPKIFDGHNDFMLRILSGSASIEGALQGLDSGQIDLPRALEGGFGGGFFAMWVPSRHESGRSSDEEMRRDHYDVPLPPMVDQREALKVVDAEVAIFRDLESAGFLTGCTSVAQLEAALKTDKLAAILHLEGAEAIDPEFEILETLYAQGLRSLGPVWSRPTIFAHGVPFRFPSTGDIGPGLTDLGRELVRACNRLKIMLDVSHLNEKGFNDLAAITDAPIVATHSNAYAVSPHARNLTDRQLDIIAESDGMVGLNFATAFLRPDGRMDADMSLDIMLRHLDHLISRLGEDRVGFGSDFDGATIPEGIRDVAGLPALRQLMHRHDFGEALIAKLCHGNWFRVLRKIWGEA